MHRHTIRDISLFVAAFEERSFTAAALRENATQSGISQRIRKLEEGFGVRLFERDAGVIAPTPAAERYYVHCIAVLHASQAATDALDEFKRGEAGSVTGGLMPTMTRRALGRPYAEMSARHPNARIAVVEGYSSELVDRLITGELDFAIVPEGRLPTGLVSDTFCTTSECLVFGPSDAHGDRGKVRLENLEGQTLIAPTPQNSRREMIDSVLRSHSVTPRRIIELDSMMATLALVRRSDAMSILPALMLEDTESQIGTASWPCVCSRPLEGIATQLVVVRQARRPESDLSREFVDLLQTECASLLVGEGAPSAGSHAAPKSVQETRSIQSISINEESRS